MISEKAVFDDVNMSRLSALSRVGSRKSDAERQSRRTSAAPCIGRLSAFLKDSFSRNFLVLPRLVVFLCVPTTTSYRDFIL